MKDKESVQLLLSFLILNVVALGYTMIQLSND
jgi:hypothetical protein